MTVDPCSLLQISWQFAKFAKYNCKNLSLPINGKYFSTGSGGCG